MGKTKPLEELAPDRSGLVALAIRVNASTAKKLERLIDRAEARAGYRPSRGQIVAGLINKASEEDKDA